MCYTLQSSIPDCRYSAGGFSIEQINEIETEVVEISLIGIILKGRYCILEQIGEGGQGRLYLARDMELGVLWAVKEIPISQKKEAKLLRLLEHPHMPRMVDYVEKDEYCYLVMEYIKGKSLGQRLLEGQKFTAEEVMDFGIAAAQVLKYLHNEKPPIYYGDLKPDNLMLSEEGKLFLVDFGSAVKGYCASQRICRGTVGYAAPEQYEGRVGKMSDVYALGRTLRELLGKNGKGILEYPGLFWVIFRCCGKNEKWRYENMEAVEKALISQRKKGGMGTGKLLFAAAVCLAAGVFLMGKEKKPQFEEAVTEARQPYYERQMQEGNFKEQCEKVEKRLQRLLRIYREKEEQRILLLSLGANSELLGNMKRAALYYEQLLLYDDGFREAYGEYGMLLWKIGEKEESLELWEEYTEKEKEGLLEEGESRNLGIWEARMDEWKKEKAYGKKETAGAGADGIGDF